MIIVAETKHYQIEDQGPNFHGRFVCRFILQRKPQYESSIVLKRHAASNTMNLLIPHMHEAEAFHLGNQPLKEKVGAA